MKKLEVFTYLCLIAVSCIAGFVLVRESVERGHRSGPQSLVEGKQLRLSGVNWQKTKHSLVVVASSHCHWCQASAPFYGKVSSIHAANRSAFQFFVISPDSRADSDAFIGEHGIAADQLISASPSSFGVRAIPTVIVVDGNGRVVYAHTGLLSDGDQKRLLGMLG
jgi:thioredoxin-related protein